VIPSDASVAHLGLLLSQIPDRALGRLYCFGGCPYFGSAVRMKAPGQTRRKIWQGATRLSTGRHRRERVKDCWLDLESRLRNAKWVLPDVAHAGIVIRRPLFDATRISISPPPTHTSIHNPQMIHSIIASSPRYKH